MKGEVSAPGCSRCHAVARGHRLQHREGSGGDAYHPSDGVDRAPGGTDDSIKIGVTYVDLSGVKDVIGFDHGDYETAYGALIDEINANGGIHGRQLELVFAPVDPSSTDAASVACTKLTQDEGVFIAVGAFLDQEMLCYIDTNETLVIGGTQTEEFMAQAKVGWWTTDLGEEQNIAAIQALIDAGDISAKVAVVGATADEAVYEASIAPILEAAGITPVDVAYMEASEDSNQTYADAQTIAERFQADGADQVLLLGNSGTWFPVGLSRTTFRPQLVFQLMQSATTFTGVEGNDLSVLEGSLATGGFDTNNDYLDLGSPTSECLATEEAAGLVLMPEKDVPEGESRQISSTMLACRTIGLLAAILEKAGPDLNYGTFTTAGYNLGEVMLPGYPNPWHFGPPPSSDGDPAVHIFAYDADAGTFLLRG